MHRGLVDDPSSAIPSLLSSIMESHSSSYCHQLVGPMPSLEPRPTDVICARGRGRWNHPGNMAFRSIVASHARRYARAATKHQKWQIVAQIASELRREGSFVVKQDPGTSLWSPISDAAVHDKIAQSLRDLRTAKFKRRPRARETKPIAFDNEDMSCDTSFSGDSINRGGTTVDDLDHMVSTNEHIKEVMRQVTGQASDLNDDESFQLFLSTNVYLLDAIKAMTSIACFSEPAAVLNLDDSSEKSSESTRDTCMILE